MRKFLNRFGLLILTVFLLVIGYLYLLVVGDIYTVKVERPTVYYDETEEGARENDAAGSDNANVSGKAWIAEDSEGSVEVLEIKKHEDDMEIKVKSQKPGRVFLNYQFEEYTGSLVVLYVHKNGLITENDYFGECTGSYELRVLWALYIAFIAIRLFRKYRRSIRKNRYLYKNILYCGLIVFVLYILLFTVLGLSDRGGAIDVLTGVMNSLNGFGVVAFVPMVLLSILVTISNIQLLRKEGRNWRNLLGTMLGITMVIACIMPELTEYYLQTTRLIDVHNWRGIGRFVGMFISNFCGSIVAYLNCILIGTIVLSVRAARHIPAFDKDYILIHGCMIRKDGTLPKLLQSRADRALEFAKMQKEATGKDIIFVPSGGKGSDEIISEAEAIRRYLKEKGVADEQILLEDRSKNTEENLKFSAELIRKESKVSDPKIAFSTTNYHVFRAGLLASDMGLQLEGIGSHTKSYFWINAFVREFIATMYSEKWTHAFVFGVLTLINLLMVIMTYVSNVVLS